MLLRIFQMLDLAELEPVLPLIYLEILIPSKRRQRDSEPRRGSKPVI